MYIRSSSSHTHTPHLNHNHTQPHRNTLTGRGVPKYNPRICGAGTATGLPQGLWPFTIAGVVCESVVDLNKVPRGPATIELPSGGFVSEPDPVYEPPHGVTVASAVVDDKHPLDQFETSVKARDAGFSLYVIWNWL